MTTSLLTVAIVSVAVSSMPALTSAQNVYRCGNSYSQTPCANGQALDVADPRTPAEKAAADAATRQTARTADAMEKSRLRDEAAARAANKPARAASGPRMLRPDDAGPPKVLRRKPKKKEPEHFTAQTPAPPKQPASRARR